MAAIDRESVAVVMTGGPTLHDVLHAAGRSMGPEEEARLRAALTGSGGMMPWYVRVLIGGGTWLGTLFLLGFFFLLLGDAFTDPTTPAIGLGLPMVAAALWLQRFRGDFARQLALVLSLTGQMLVIFATGAVTGSEERAALLALLFGIGLLPLHPDRVHRFFSTLIAIGGLLVLLHESRVPGGAQIGALLLVALAAGFWRLFPAAWRGRHRELLDAAVPAIVVALLVLLAMSSFEGLGSADVTYWHRFGPVTTVGTAAALLAVGASIFREHRVELTAPIPLAAAAAVVAIAVFAWRAPAIPVALLVIVLAFDRRNQVVLGLGAAFFVIFGALFYYDLQLTLLQKSGALAGSGLVCLAAWVALRAGVRRPA
ncbi:MAG TPA: DUF4401 domain-containing protein [Vicinamibacterales bacterium]